MPIDVAHIGFAYGDRVIFDDLSCQFSEGMVTGLIGPSGSGKSTLIALLIGQLAPGRGRISYPAALLDRGVIAPRRVAWVMQSANLFTRRTAAENVALPLLANGTRRRDAMTRAETALDRVGLGARLHDRGGLLSGGERQRVAVARALAVRAPLLIADEPTVSLDQTNRDRLVQTLLAAAEAGTIVITATHDPEVARACHRRVAL